MDGYAERLAELRHSLDGLGDASLEDQARGVLLHLLDELPEGPSDVVRLDPKHCPNCDAPVPSLRTPFCGEPCRASAALVRQLRSGIATGAAHEAERQVAFGQTIWKLLGGGMPLRRSLAPERAVRQAIARSEGKCVVCGAPAIDVDHVGSG